MKHSASALPKHMTMEPQQPEFSAPQPEPIVSAAPTEEEPRPVAPIWHTLLIVGLILANSFAGSSKLGAVHGTSSRIALYGGTFITQSILILLIWFGIHLRKVRMRDLIGGRWKTVEAFLLDVMLAGGFLVISDLILFGLRIAVGTVDIHNMQKTVDDTLRMLGPLAPHTYLEAAFYVLLSVSAGLFEEIIFRGYLQSQFRGLSKNAAVGIIGSGIIFGLAHGYQGKRMMVVIAVYGMFFGILAHFRKSLRPGMMAHAMQDSLAGLTLFRLVTR